MFVAYSISTRKKTKWHFPKLIRDFVLLIEIVLRLSDYSRALLKS